mmetsp:Transcript_9202/g.13857  ORF Transcript_9202/g.13857 Transcript_9202/m.13857 type:complete len:446 (+) Transcript_9202:125-1462(+)|eukprot:CAMPEP_0185035974 /NCGR_PEP_ID=MMETSP1103-20130426/28264_1 /TAXON_ID=36769 /ORGANISM="Paraphysomonas bandaiensis, Strain Caron Lab Isolate" /LENGTH=445 /DNA_ID=CAMNT_0027573307 /DNA_START=65 /DNA_END=1402 /DNA_ORIENTATION=+
MSSYVVMLSSGRKIEFPVNENHTVGHLLKSIEKKLKIPACTIRLLYCGRELKPSSAPLSSFEIGRFNNYVIHMSTTTVDVLGDTVEPAPRPLHRSGANSGFVDLTSDPADVLSVRPVERSTVDLTDGRSTASQLGSPLLSEAANNVAARRIKKRRLDIDRGVDHSLSAASSQETTSSTARSAIASSRALRIRIARALNHRLYLLEHRLVFNTTGKCLEGTVQGAEGPNDQHRVTIGQRLSCTCDDCTAVRTCKHIIFVLIKVLRVPLDSPLIERMNLSRDDVDRIIQQSGLFISPQIANERGVEVIDNGPLARRRANLSQDATIQAAVTSVSSGQLASPLTALPYQENDSERSEEKDEEVEECPICFESLWATTVSGADISVREELATCDICANSLHRDCLQKWQQQSQTCPFCRNTWRKARAPPKSKKKLKQAQRPRVIGRRVM